MISLTALITSIKAKSDKSKRRHTQTTKGSQDLGPKFQCNLFKLYMMILWKGEEMLIFIPCGIPQKKRRGSLWRALCKWSTTSVLLVLWLLNMWNGVLRMKYISDTVHEWWKSSSLEGPHYLIQPEQESSLRKKMFCKTRGLMYKYLCEFIFVWKSAHAMKKIKFKYSKKCVCVNPCAIYL